ncbi:hypothetical protein [Acidithiobacillus ferriphilus]|uniref:hypothetical protein n=1 Tax=Acidithiobacillus ferriphilus TaxID=1689834 RepID=UPI002DB69BBD|nr:hypothetical protein [Acidithiobacillus ferriphilus]MEB8535524.1 hypothetical protein [Acidithiobacillus ferriphilus]
MVTLDLPGKTAAQKALASLDIEALYIAARAAHREGRQDIVQEFLERMKKYCHVPIRRAQRRSGKTEMEISSDVYATLMGMLDADEPLAVGEVCSIGTRLFTRVQNMLAQDQDMEIRHHSIHVYGDEAVEMAATGETNAQKHRKEMNHCQIQAYLERLGRVYLNWYMERRRGRSPEAIVAEDGIPAPRAAIYEQRMVYIIELLRLPQQSYGAQTRKICKKDY